MPQKHDNYTRSIFDGIGEGVWVGGTMVSFQQKGETILNLLEIWHRLVW
jgi:hypothetical protein